MTARFSDRRDAGRRLAARLAGLGRERPGPVVLALPRGGVPVGAEIAGVLGADLDVLVVRKLGVPWHPELAMGAIASGDVRLLNRDVIASLGLTDDEVEAVARTESRELARRERVYRGDRPALPVDGRTAIVVDDGAATGATMAAALRAVRGRGPARLVAALPVASPEAVERLGREADVVVCLLAPEPFVAIGVWYREFPQLEDAEVRSLLQAAYIPPR